MQDAAHTRRRFHVRGIVQGVGFRPFVFSLARERGLGGHVRNGPDGVTIEVEGPQASLDEFERALRRQGPPLARVETIAVSPMPARGDAAFAIVESAAAGSRRTWIAPDAAICDACLAELFDPANRRYRHPFITCTDCGPRFTIVTALPYDRASTTMARFPMCERCDREYHDPADRRFHAQPIACPQCGPRLWLARPDGAAAAVDGDALAQALETVSAGGIVAVKGVGGFHLLCDAANGDALSRLRARKRRPFRPFALLVADVNAAERLIDLPPSVRTEMSGPARPIVLADRLSSADVADLVAPRVHALGVMLPHAPLQALLAADWTSAVRARRTAASGALVLTSANVSGLPMLIANDEARHALAGIADAFLLHDRDIQVRCDDSVIAAAKGRAPVPVRRSRGYTPAPLPLPAAGEPILAVGGELKAAFCLAADGQAFLGPHVGDMETIETLDSFTAAVDHFCRVLDIEPRVYVSDAHPGYLSARWAEQAGGSAVVRVQHHHAHAASLMAEHQMDAGAALLTFCFDGTGYGNDGAMWGGEVLRATYEGFARVAHLAYAPQPGGDAAVRYPWRMAQAYCVAAGIEMPAPRADRLRTARVIEQQVARGIAVVPTSSMGRLFDAVASMLDVCDEATYEGQAAIELEAVAATATAARPYTFGIEAAPGAALQIAWAPVLRAIAADIAAGHPAPDIAAGFHDAVAELVASIASRALARDEPRRVGLTGGVFQNMLLLRLACTKLDGLAIQAITHAAVPPNDGGLALGQAAIAAARGAI